MIDVNIESPPSMAGGSVFYPGSHGPVEITGNLDWLDINRYRFKSGRVHQSLLP